MALNGWKYLEEELPDFEERVELLILSDGVLDKGDHLYVIENNFHIGQRICTSARGELFFIEGLQTRKDEIGMLTSAPRERSFFRRIELPDFGTVKGMILDSVERRK
jgi:hypothetical protein